MIFTYTDGEGDDHQYSHQRTQFDAVIEGRPAAEVITDICRAGRISVPFQYEGKYTIQPLKALTSGELSAVPVFIDRGANCNILRTGGGGTTLRIEQEISDKDLTNEVILSFEYSENFDLERPITVDDPNQKLKAGRSVGQNAPKPNTKNYFAFGTRNESEAIKLAYALLWFGEFDEGGVKNNLRISFEVDYVFALGIKKYDVIKVESDLLTGKGYTDPFTLAFTQFQYFRVIQSPKDSGNRVRLFCQAYNEDAVDAFETATGSPDPPSDPDTPIKPIGLPSFGSATYSSGVLTIPIIQAYDAATSAFLTATSITDTSIAAAIDTLVRAMKAGTLWAKMQAVYPFVGGSASAHAVNLANPGTFDLTFSGGWAHASTGATPNGSTGYADTGFNLSTNSSLNDGHQSIYSRTDASAASVAEMSAATGNSNRMMLEYGDSKFYISWGDAGGTAGFANTDSSGYFIANRTGASVINGWIDGNKVINATRASTSLPNANLLLGKYAAISAFSTKEIAFATIGTGLSDAEAAELYSLIQAFQTTLGREV
ncbi:MAG: hypothetical protein R2747_04945 [Pyrinomonadaceae bacterium]